MLLTNVRLKNLRVFEDAEFDLTDPDTKEPLKVVLLAGGNGSGKSTFLDAVAAIFSTHVAGYGGDKLTPEDVRQGRDAGRVIVGLLDAIRAKQNALTLSHSELGLTQASFDTEDAAFTTSDEVYFDLWRQSIIDRQRRATGVIVLHDVHRILPPSIVAGPNRQSVPQARWTDALKQTVSRTGNVAPRHRSLKQWIVNLDFQRAKAKADRNEELDVWHTLRAALDRLLHPYTFDRVDERFEVWFKTPSGRVRLEALSEGFRSVFVIIVDLLMRLHLSTDDPTKLLEQEAVCLIDEIDAHLHPKWQETVIPGLTAMFPNVQFIATTHSPIVVGTVEPKNVFLLEGL